MYFNSAAFSYALLALYHHAHMLFVADINMALCYSSLGVPIPDSRVCENVHDDGAQTSITGACACKGFAVSTS